MWIYGTVNITVFIVYERGHIEELVKLKGRIQAMKILSIGNSFSQDAQRYLHEIAAVNGKNLKCVNLYIGGCSLKQHYFHMLDDEKAYDFEFNGMPTGIKVSIREALKSDDWDYITLQQASRESFDFEHYIPYIERLAEYVRLYLPKTKILLHQTWAYCDDKEKLSGTGYGHTSDMFRDVKDAYHKAAERIHADGIIESGQAILNAYQKNPDIIYRDGFHVSLGFGRYLLGLTWYRTLYGDCGTIQHMQSFDAPVSETELKLAEEMSRIAE